jgi:lipopolysaccharide transport system ATP-binding protein
MSSNDIAIKVEHLSKTYLMYDRPADRLKQFIVPRLQKMIRKYPKTYFHEFWALRDVSFEVKKGETVGIIGRNGSGKSTLLQLICGTLTPVGGSVQTHGRVAALLELGSGFNLEFTGRENVYMNGAVLGLSTEEIDARFDEIAAFADIGEFIEQPVKMYLSGMIVRLAFAVAINVDPQILIVDEALSVGDELFQRKCFSRIETIKKNGTTILFVSHSGSAVVELCDRAILLDAGEKLAIGSPKHIVGMYQKLIYAPHDKHELIREEIQASASGFPASKDNTYDDDDLEEIFDPNLQPQSTLSYEMHGARIETPEIFSTLGKKVNCIKRGKEYLYTYKVRFDKGATNVRFGMLIKTTTGLELGGAMSAPNISQGIPYLLPGTIINVEFRFVCNLNPGLYFLNAGVMGIEQQQDTFLHRLIDACIFKVMPVANNTSTAIIDFNCEAAVEIMNSSLEKIETT